MNVEFSGEIIHWRGPSPFHFVTVPVKQAVRRVEQVELGDLVTVRLTLDV